MKRVLIVDDAIDVCRMLQDAFKTTYPDVRVSVMPSAEEALLESYRYTIDLLVADIRLPGMTGVELLRKIRMRQPQVKVILMTGMNPDEWLNQQTSEVAPDYFVRKPLQLSAFLDTVESLFGKSDQAEKPAEKETTTSRRGKKEKEEPAPAVPDALAGILPGEPAAPEPKKAPARKKTGVLKPPEPPEEEQKVSGVLSRLRVSVGAASAMLLDDRGHPVAQAGDLPSISAEDQLFSAVMASVSSGGKLAYLLGQTAVQSVQAYCGADYDLVLAPVGQYALMVVIRSESAHLRLALAFEEALNAQVELATALEGMGLRVYSSAEMGAPGAAAAGLEDAKPQPAAESAGPLETGPEQAAGLAQFEELFSAKGASQVSLADSDSFWDAASSETKEISQPGVLSFEEASKLGLVPKEE